MVKGPKSGSPPPWHASLSLGLAFNSEGVPDKNDPIPFVRFWAPPATADTDLIIRMPISAASLAEVRAMYAEYLWIRSEEERHPSGGTPANSSKWLLEYGAAVYKEDNLEYTTALHLLANRIGAKLVWEILEQASALAGIVLNFPASLVRSLRIPKMWDDTWGAGCPHGDRIQPLLSRRDPGFIFALLCNYATTPGTTKLSEWLESVLQAAGGFGFTELKTEWEKELSASVVIGESKGAANDLKVLWLTRGLDWALASDPTSPPEPLLRALNSDEGFSLPGALTADFDLWFPAQSTGYADKSVTLSRVDWLEKVIMKMDEFCDVCVR